MRFQIVKSRWPVRQRWHFRIVAVNGLTLASSETYRHKDDCLAAVELIRRDAPTASVFPKPGL